MMTIASSIIAITLLTQATSTQPAPGFRLADDRLIGSAFPSRSPDVPSQHLQVRTEPRDTSWAERTEAALRARYAQAPLDRALAGPVRVTCGSTLCEVAGAMFSSADQRRIDDAMKALQGPAFRQATGALGLNQGSISFGSPAGRPTEVVFVAYLTRTDHAS